MGCCHYKSIEEQIIEELSNFIKESELTEEQKKFANEELKNISEVLKKEKKNLDNLSEEEKQKKMKELKKLLMEAKHPNP